MKNEDELVTKLLEDFARQLETHEIVESIIAYDHKRWGMLSFKLNTITLNGNDFAPGTLGIVFSINKCRSILFAGNIDSIREKIDFLISEKGRTILDEIPNYYRLLFDQP